jgi:hypothetical protein
MIVAKKAAAVSGLAKLYPGGILDDEPDAITGTAPWCMKPRPWSL